MGRQQARADIEREWPRPSILRVLDDQSFRQGRQIELSGDRLINEIKLGLSEGTLTL
jgi:hypothetical protein